MASRKQFEAELAKHEGASLDADTIDVDFHVQSPPGHVWRASFNHTLTANHCNSCGQSYKSEAYSDLIDRMRYGLEPCEDGPMCEHCYGRG